VELVSLPADEAWVRTLQKVLNWGSEVGPRGKKTLEILSHEVAINMDWPIVTVPSRKLGYRFMCAEAAWILSGDDRVETIAPYSKTVSQFSDDGVTFYGAYGPRYRDQLDNVVAKLRQDPETRQAVMSIWRPNPPETKDVPCTVDYQFLIRGGQLHMIVNMRSNDVWLGFPYDVFSATMVAAHVLLHVVHDHPRLELGTLFHRAGSRHLYEKDLDAARRCCLDVDPPVITPGPFRPAVQFASPERLISHLWALARHDRAALRSVSGLGYLEELIP